MYCHINGDLHTAMHFSARDVDNNNQGCVLARTATAAAA